ncbi:MAG: hypothetical protein KA782_04185, partial [Flavobacterium sp.]|nr:hypothetical protein [Flavobacterium sp.]
MKINYKYSTLLLIGIFIIILALLVIAGWVFDIATFRTVFPGFVPMKINTAVCFLISGMIYLCRITGRWSPRCRFVSFLLFIFGLLSLSQNIFDINLGIDEFLMTDYDAIKMGLINPGHPSPATSICFSLYGLALLGIDSKNIRYNKWGQY